MLHAPLAYARTVPQLRITSAVSQVSLLLRSTTAVAARLSLLDLGADGLVRAWWHSGLQQSLLILQQHGVFINSLGQVVTSPPSDVLSPTALPAPQPREEPRAAKECGSQRAETNA